MAETLKIAGCCLESWRFMSF